MAQNTGFTLANRCLPRQAHNLKKQNDYKKKKKKKVHAHSLCFLHAVHLCFLHAHRSPEQNDFEEERVLAVPSTSSNLCFLLWGCAILCLPEPPPHQIYLLLKIYLLLWIKFSYKIDCSLKLQSYPIK